jgi:hypothetical protein
LGKPLAALEMRDDRRCAIEMRDGNGDQTEMTLKETLWSKSQTQAFP